MCHVSCVMFHVSPVTCHMSRVTCHVSHVTYHLSPVKKVFFACFLLKKNCRRIQVLRGSCGGGQVLHQLPEEEGGGHRHGGKDQLWPLAHRPSGKVDPPLLLSLPEGWVPPSTPVPQPHQRCCWGPGHSLYTACYTLHTTHYTLYTTH